MDLNDGDAQAATVSSVMDAFSNQGFKTESVDVHIAEDKDKVPSAKEPIYDDTPIADTYFWPVFHCRYQFKFSVSSLPFWNEIGILKVVWIHDIYIWIL